MLINSMSLSQRIRLYIITLPVILTLGACQRSGTALPAPDTASAPTAAQLAQDLAQLSAHDDSLPAAVSHASTPPADIQQFCGDCHALPRADSFERDVWYQEIRQGYEFYARSGRTDLNPPPLESVLRYYRATAPERIEFPPPPAIDAKWVSRFTTTKLDWKDADYITPGVSSITWVELLGPNLWHLLV